MSTARLSVIIAAKNEAHQISDCIRSVSFADEVIVLDSSSVDGTERVAREAGAQVHVTDWPGYGPQQLRGIRLATGDWVLSLDADERVSPALKDEILQAIREPRAEGYRLPRHSSFCGQFIDHSGWRPDYTLRLVRRDLAGFTDHFLHAHMTVDGRKADLRQPIIHYSYRDLDDVLDKLNRYSRGAAIDLQRKGRRSSLSRALASGFFAFVRTYVLRQGFRDGRMGFVLALYNAQTTYYKYLRLWMMDRETAKAPVNPR
ncbi:MULTISPECIES: glycosyltransferase family 2 protein [Ramlibacter]|uniref:Glycosyltransferase family 2 protein n=1 Tax=Ramlibacter aquaticus TaxID=2780094 RepID=A0ABR9SAI0_9BURK|nr:MULTISPECIES: glycosyltransferase family 2 protein [Ramlibacter]MBE7939305.1 glycosyltransferase family 2 protein [Ramlibacter aquaticus]